MKRSFCKFHEDAGIECETRSECAVCGWNPEVEARRINRLRNGEDSPVMVYICSAYSGDVEANVQAARAYCRKAVNEGMMPVAPHLLYPQFLNDDKPKERKMGLRFGLELLRRCSLVWVFGEITEGMRSEIDEAERLRIPVAYKEV